MNWWPLLVNVSTKCYYLTVPIPKWFRHLSICVILCNHACVCVRGRSNWSVDTVSIVQYLARQQTLATFQRPLAWDLSSSMTSSAYSHRELLLNCTAMHSCTCLYLDRCQHFKVFMVIYWHSLLLLHSLHCIFIKALYHLLIAHVRMSSSKASGDLSSRFGSWVFGVLLFFPYNNHRIH